ncbi:hypothetical protein CI789_02645 [Erwinia persicina]|nr:hypothetical protein CI789_02645 [Erwinia persicina]
MDSRAQFEAWMKKTGQNPPYATKRGLWEVWKASRAAIEVALPGKVSKLNTTDNGFVLSEAENYDEAIDDCAEAIRVCGISIKGESS